MKTFYRNLVIAFAIFFGFLVLAPILIAEAGTILQPLGGGTGNSTSPTYGQVLVGNAGGTYSLVATSTLGLGGSGGGTVSSVSLTAPTGLTVSGSPVTSSGTLGLSLTSGYVIPLTASTTQWNNLYNASTSLPTGPGTTNKIPKFTTSTTIGDSKLNDTGTQITFGNAANNAAAPVIAAANALSTGIDWPSSSGGLSIVSNGVKAIKIPVMDGSGNTISINNAGTNQNTEILGSSGIQVLSINGANNRVGILAGSDSSLIKNALDVNGAVVIGNSYALTNTAPSNGLLIQGTVGIGTTTPGSILSVQGVGNFTTATSTFNSTGGINLASGCFAINGVCVGGAGGGGSGTVNSGTTGQFPYYASSGTAVTATSTLFLNASGFIGISTTTPSATLDVQGSIATLEKQFSATLDASLSTTTYSIYGWTQTNLIGTLTLPLCNATDLGLQLTIKDESGNAASSTLSVTAKGSDTIDGTTTQMLDANYQSIGLYCSLSAGKWFIK